MLVDLWAPWCGPCRMVSPVLQQLATEMAGRIKLVKVNSDVAPQVSQRFEVQAIPTLVLLDRGEVVARQIGAAPAMLCAAGWSKPLPEERPGDRLTLPFPTRIWHSSSPWPLEPPMAARSACASALHGSTCGCA